MTHTAERNETENGKRFLRLQLRDGEVGFAEGHNGPAILIPLGKVLEINVPLAAGGIWIIDPVGPHMLDARKLGPAHLSIFVKGLCLRRPATVGVDDHSACWWGHCTLGLEVALDVDAQGALILAGVSESKDAIISLERSHRLDARNGQLLDRLLHGPKHAVVALLDQLTQNLFILGLHRVS